MPDCIFLTSSAASCVNLFGPALVHCPCSAWTKQDQHAVFPLCWHAGGQGQAQHLDPLLHLPSHRSVSVQPQDMCECSKIVCMCWDPLVSSKRLTSLSAAPVSLWLPLTMATLDCPRWMVCLYVYHQSAFTCTADIPCLSQVPLSTHSHSSILPHAFCMPAENTYINL